MKLKRKLLLIGLLLVILTMVVATQFATTRITYTYDIVHPSNADIRFIGHDNSSDGLRVLRVVGQNSTTARLALDFGNLTSDMEKTYTAAIGIVNEERFALGITHINVSSVNYSYLKIWLHGNVSVDAENTTQDPSSVFMFNNGTVVNDSTTIAWTLGAGNQDTTNMCANISDPTNYTIDTPWDETSHVRYSQNTTYVNTTISDYVWVQISVDIPTNVDTADTHTGIIWFHFKSVV